MLLAGCSGAQLKEQSQRADALGKQIVEKDHAIEALQAKKGELEGQVTDQDAKLKAAQSRIDELVKSNQDLSETAKSKGELSEKLAQLVAEKDELSRKLNELAKDKIALDRAKAVLLARREKMTAELASLRQQKEELLSKVDETVSSEKRRGDDKQARLAKTHEELGVLADAILRPIQQDKAGVAQDGESIVVTLQESLLFEAGQAKLGDEGTAALDKLGAALHAVSGRMIRVQGHSDNTAVKRELFGGFAGNWELSAARATAVARYLHEHSGLDPRLLSVEAYGEFRPAKPNDGAEGRAANRRVALVIDPAR